MKNPHDGRFKGLAEDHPELLLRLFRILQSGEKTQTIHILRELLLDPVQVDHVYRLEGAHGARFVHFEAISKWHSERVPLLALYRFLLRHKYKLPVASYLVMMAEKYAPKTMPDKLTYEEEDGFRIETPYQVIRLWELDPAMAFEKGNEALLPWVPLLKGGAEEFERAIEAIAELRIHPESAPYPVETMVSQIASLATLRYDKNAIGLFLEELREKKMLSIELFKDSWLYEEGVSAGVAKGEARGKRELLQLALRQRYPQLADVAQLDRVDSPEALESLMLLVLGNATAEEIQAAIAEAQRPS